MFSNKELAYFLTVLVPKLSLCVAQSREEIQLDFDFGVQLLFDLVLLAFQHFKVQRQRFRVPVFPGLLLKIVGLSLGHPPPVFADLELGLETHDLSLKLAHLVVGLGLVGRTLSISLQSTYTRDEGLVNDSILFY